ncbi:MAG: hypothetical protein AB8B97_17325 [Granulosicoccus sp.]
MKAEMYDQNINRTMWASLWVLSVFAAMILAGCEGGIKGTGSGPKDEIYDAYQLRNLPERISPDIPKTLIQGVEPAPSQPENQDTIEEEMRFSSRMDDRGKEK